MHIAWAGFELTTSMVVGIVYKAKYHTITTTTSPFDVQFACEKMYSALK
jgi:hypothetical protein